MRAAFDSYFRHLLRWANAAGVAVLLGLYTAVMAQAATATGSLTVQMTITASCTISAATLNFGTLSGTSVIAVATNASVNVSVTCTNGSPYSIAMNNGANASGSQRRMTNGTGFINYNLFTDAGRTSPWTTATSSTTCTSTNSCYLGTGNGAAQSVPVFGQVPAVGSAPTAGTYTDTVTMTITY
jgi:spore coat protein U-like protein